MNPNTKKILTQSLAVLGVTILTGGAYFFASSGSNFQAQLIGADQSSELTLVDGAMLPTPIDGAQTAQQNSEVVSSVFDATPTQDNTSDAVMTGTTMTGITMSGTLLATSEPTDLTEVQALMNLRPAAMESTNTLLDMFGGQLNANTNSVTEVVSSAVTAADILAPFRAETTDASNTNTNTQDTAAKAALEQAPHVPQTGAESWLLAVSILCAMMGMTMLVTSPKTL